MKCQKCDRVATFHITEMIDANPQELHLCDHHAYEYLHQNDALRSPNPEKRRQPGDYDVDENSELERLTEELEASDFQVCSCCGFGFQEFRKTGRLGCANDYQTFRDRLEPLMLGVHGALKHCGKRPARYVASNRGATLVQLRSELADAIEIEDYERASKLRDKIAELAKGAEKAEKKESKR